LIEFKKARIALEESAAEFWAESRHNDQLLHEAEQAAATEFEGDVSRAQVWLQGRRNRLSERPEFVQAYQDHRSVRISVDNLRSQLEPPLSRLAVQRDEVVQKVVNRLDRLPRESSPQNVDIIIGLLEELLNSARKVQSPRESKRSRIRSIWLDEKLSACGWSDVDLATHGGPAYNTIRRYRSGATSSRDRYVRQRIAKTLHCSFEDVPE
jgi:hypothetical protein